MKKVLLSLLVMGAGALSAQVISFEQSEGFFPGDITGQVTGWQSTGIQGGGNIEGQNIVDTMSSDGSQSFANVTVEDYGSQANLIIGAQYDFVEPVAWTPGFTLTYDFYGTDPMYGMGDGVATDFMLALAEFDRAEPAYITRIYVANDGGVYIIGRDDMGVLVFLPTTGEWTQSVWNTIKLTYDGINMTLFLNDVEISSGSPEISDAGFVDHMRLYHDNNGGDLYYDNIRFNDTASVNDIGLTRGVSTVYPNPAIDVVNIKLAEDFNTAKTMVSVTNVSGQNVAKFANVNEVNVSKLPAGVYILTITDGTKTETKKLIKK